MVQLVCMHLFGKDECVFIKYGHVTLESYETHSSLLLTLPSLEVSLVRLCMGHILFTRCHGDG